MALLSASMSQAGSHIDRLSNLSLDQLLDVEIVSISTQLPTRRTEAPGTVYSFTRDDFKRLGIRRIEQLLELVPGFQLNQYRKRHQAIWSRGVIARENNNLVLVLDGIPQRRPYYGQFDLGEMLPLDRVERVEIVLGPASTLYGANAFGGVISVTTRARTEEGVNQLSLELGDNRRALASLWLGDQDTRLFASALGQQAPFSDDRASFIGVAAVQPLDERAFSLYLRHAMSDQLSLALDLRHQESPFLFIPPTQDAWVEINQLTLDLQWRDEISEAAIWFAADRTREYEVEQQTRRVGLVEHQYADSLGASFRHLLLPAAGHRLLIGGEWRRELARELDFWRSFHFADGFYDEPLTGQLVSDPSFRHDNAALYLQDIWSLRNDLTLTLGMRFDAFEDFGGHLNYRAALVQTLSPQSSWKVQFGTAIRTPTYREYLKVLEDSDFIPSVPDPEQLRTIELGYHRNQEGYALDLTLFHNQLDDFLRETPTPDGEDEYFANSASPWRMTGIELLLSWSPSATLSIRSGGSWTDINWDQPGAVPYLSEATASLAFDWQYHPRHHLGLSLVWNSRRRETNVYPGDTPGDVKRLRLFGGGSLRPGLEYRFGVDNLLDRRIHDPAADFGGQTNTEEPRREIWASLSWTLGS